MTGLSHAEAMRALIEALDEARQARDAARADARILRESERRALEQYAHFEREHGKQSGRAQRAERERDQAIRERDAALDVRDVAHRDVDAYIHAKNDALDARDNAINEADALRRERDDARARVLDAGITIGNLTRERDEAISALLSRDEDLTDARSALAEAQRERDEALRALADAAYQSAATQAEAVRMERRLGDYCPTVVRHVTVPGKLDRVTVAASISARPATVDPCEGDRTALALLVAELGRDEVRTLLYLARRLDMGAKQYGALNLATDRRDWRAEAYAEFADGAIYAAFAGLRVTSPDEGGER